LSPEPGDEERAVGKGAVLHRNGGVVFLYPSLHLGKQRLAQILGVGHRRLLVGVLRLEMGADLRVEDRGILEHGLPVVGPQPGIIVRPRDAVPGIRHGLAGGAGRGGQGFGKGQGIDSR
jgi:hypothetical protein